MITYSFFHRTTQNDKVYGEDLWVLSYFHEGNAESFVNVPWALACYMEKRGAGTRVESQMCCGHFISRIARNMTGPKLTFSFWLAQTLIPAFNKMM